jgi:hypothetical protein
VASREVDLAIINPAAVLSVAMRGKGIFKQPMPVRAIAVIPSWDQVVFAVRPETGLLFLEDIARRKPKLRILMRAAGDHTLHHMFDDVAAASGFSRGDIGRWGGEVRKAGTVPWPQTDTFKALIRDNDSAACRGDGRDPRGDGLSPCNTAASDLSQIAGGRPIAGFQRLDRFCSFRSGR